MIILNAKNKSLGRLATEIAKILIGKNKSNYSPNKDMGSQVRVVNLNQLKFTGRKLEQKKYYRYSGFPGGLKSIELAKIYKQSPEKVLKSAVEKMLPKNKLQTQRLKRLIIE